MLNKIKKLDGVAKNTLIYTHHFFLNLKTKNPKIKTQK
jgi:hypothetical protein